MNIEKVFKTLLIDEKQILNAYLFGSRVYGTNSKDADYDLMMISRPGYIPQRDFEGTVEVVEETFQVLNYKQYKRYLVTDAKEHMISVGIYDLDIFLDVLCEHVILFMFCIHLPKQFRWKEEIKFTLCYPLDIHTSKNKMGIDDCHGVISKDCMIQLRMRRLRHSILNESNRTWQKCKNMYLREHNHVKARKLIVYTCRYLNWGIQLANHAEITDFKWGNHIHEKLFPSEFNPKLLDFEYVKSLYADTVKQIQTQFTLIAHNKISDSSSNTLSSVDEAGKVRQNRLSLMMSVQCIHDAINALCSYVSKYGLPSLTRDFSLRIVKLEENLYQLHHDPLESPLEYDIVRICNGIVIKRMKKHLDPNDISENGQLLHSIHYECISFTPFYMCNKFEIQQDSIHSILFKQNIHLIGQKKSKLKSWGIMKSSQFFSLFVYNSQWYVVPIDVTRDYNILLSFWDCGQSFSLEYYTQRMIDIFWKRFTFTLPNMDQEITFQAKKYSPRSMSFIFEMIPPGRFDTKSQDNLIPSSISLSCMIAMDSHNGRWTQIDMEHAKSILMSFNWNIESSASVNISEEQCIETIESYNDETNAVCILTERAIRHCSKYNGLIGRIDGHPPMPVWNTCFFQLESPLQKTLYRLLHFVEDCKNCFFENIHRIPQGCHEWMVQLIRQLKLLEHVSHHSNDESDKRENDVKSFYKDTVEMVRECIIGYDNYHTTNKSDKEHCSQKFLSDLFDMYNQKLDVFLEKVETAYYEMDYHLREKIDSTNGYDIRLVTDYLNETYKKKTDCVVKNACFSVFYSLKSTGTTTNTATTTTTTTTTTTSDSDSGKLSQDEIEEIHKVRIKYSVRFMISTLELRKVMAMLKDGMKQ